MIMMILDIDYDVVDDDYYYYFDDDVDVHDGDYDDD